MIRRLTASLFVLLGACGDSSTPRTPLTVWVIDASEGLSASERPFPGADVALDTARGERTTKKTDADGKVTFDADYGAGPASVTVFSSDHVYTTMLDVAPETLGAFSDRHGKPEGDLVIVPPRLDTTLTPESVEVRGTIAGKKTFNSEVGLATSTLPRLGTYHGTGTAYAVRAPKNVPFALFGYESNTVVDDAQNIAGRQLLRAFRLPLEARADDQILDLDLSALALLPTRAFSVEADLPFGAATRVSASVASADSGIELGLFAGADTAGPRATIEIAAIDVDIAPERVVSQVTLIAPDGATTTRAEAGPMTPGQSWTGFPTPPIIARPDESRRIDEPVVVESFPPGAEFVTTVYAATQVAWVLHAPLGGPRDRTIRVPYRGEITSADVQLFALNVTARFDRTTLAPAGTLVRASATSRDVILRKR